MRLSHEEKRGFLTERRELFFRTICKEMASSDQLRLYFMEIDGAKAAGILCFDYKNKRYLYNSGFDPIHSKLSVGLLLKATALHDSIVNGFDYFDFLRGDENYKYDLGGIDSQLFSLSLHR
jgi:CelD/BcsL family acetyltransferase involved in cellulose biosynthesis